MLKKLSQSLQLSLLPLPYYLFLAVSIAIGIVLRLVWLSDMEYKGDEANLYNMAREVIQNGAPIPWLGMVSSQALENPAMGSWVYIALGYLFGVSDPTQICWGTRIFNCIGLLLLASLVFHFRDALRRKVFLWTVAIAAISPFAVLWQRKIWVIAVLPFFMSLFFLLWCNRKKHGAISITVGAWGALFCQLHLASFFFLAAFLLFEAARDYREKSFALKTWIFHCVGLVLGSLSMIPWVLRAIEFQRPPSATIYLWGELIRFRFWRFFFTEPFGLKLTYSLGDQHFQEFMASFGGIPAMAHYILYSLLGVFLLSFLHSSFQLLKGRKFEAFFLGENSLETWVRSAFWGYGILISLITIHALVYRHYFLTCYPLTFLFLAGHIVKNFKWAKSFLILCWCAQLVVTIAFLCFIHETGGTRYVDGDYGTVYRLQKK